MKRLLFNIAAVVSLVLCLATIALWVRSFWATDMWRYALAGKPYTLKNLTMQDHKGIVCSLRSGGLFFGYFVIRKDLTYDWRSGPEFFEESPDGYPHLSHLGRSAKGWELCWFVWACDTSSNPRWTHTWGYFEKDRVFIVPAAVAAAFFSVMPLVVLLRLGRNLRTRSRRAAGLCTHCGYDLRETAARCPECGHLEVRQPLE